jgi:IMP dehydrogenase
MTSKAHTELDEILERVEGAGMHRVEDVALTFDDILLKPAKAEIHPSQVDVQSLFSRNIPINVPVCSAAMDTVTESELAIALAREGGIGVIHRNITIDDQAAMVDRVKRSESGMITNPVTVEPETPVHRALEIMREFSISGVPVVKRGRLVGILTNRDLRFEERLSRPVSEVMTSRGLITVAVGTTLEEAQALLHEHRIEKLPVVDESFNLKGLITVKDIQKRARHPNACKDHLGRLRVAAAVGAAGDFLERASELVQAGADAIVIDSAHGHSRGVMDAAAQLREMLTDRDLVAGNVATKEGAEDLAALDVDAVKVGMGPGSICTTRVVSGAGMPQMTAIFQAVAICEPKGIPVIADGGIRYSGDVVKAIAAGAHSVMIGSLFAGTTESPGDQVLLEGRAYKVYRGMGSLGALRCGGSADRYFQEGVSELRKLVAEGIEGRVPYKGPLDDSVFQMVGGLRAGMGYSGAKNIEELRKQTRFVRVTTAGLNENHPHNVSITREAPNYEVR